MNELNLKFAGIQNAKNLYLQINDKPVKLKKNQFNNYTCKFQTQDDTAKIKVYNYLDVGGVLWFFTQLLFFIISVFGIFDVHNKEKQIIINLELDVKLKDVNNITFQAITHKDAEKAFEIQSDTEYKEITNISQIDTRAKKTFKILLFTKIVLAILIIALAILLIILNL